MNQQQQLTLGLGVAFLLIVAVLVYIFFFKNKCRDEKKPYYNETTKKCEVCPAGTPQWNSSTKTCEVCPAGTPNWDSNIKDCVKCEYKTPLWDSDTNTCYAGITTETPTPTGYFKLENSTLNVSFEKDLALSGTKPDVMDEVIKVCNNRDDCKGVTCVNNIGYCYAKGHDDKGGCVLGSTTYTKNDVSKSDLFKNCNRKMDSSVEKTYENYTKHIGSKVNGVSIIGDGIYSNDEAIKICNERKDCLAIECDDTNNTCKSIASTNKYPYEGTLDAIEITSDKNYTSFVKKVLKDPEPSTMCRYPTPIWNAETEKCEKCEYPTPIWNAETEKCEKCKYPTPKWNSDEGYCDRCRDPTPKWNPATEECEACEYPTPKWNYDKKVCEECPTEIPSWRGYAIPKWNPETKKCEACEFPTPIWNPETKECEACSDPTPKWNPGTKECESYDIGTKTTGSNLSDSEIKLKGSIIPTFTGSDCPRGLDKLAVYVDPCSANNSDSEECKMIFPAATRPAFLNKDEFTSEQKKQKAYLYKIDKNNIDRLLKSGKSTDTFRIITSDYINYAVRFEDDKIKKDGWETRQPLYVCTK